MFQDISDSACHSYALDKSLSSQSIYIARPRGIGHDPPYPRDFVKCLCRGSVGSFSRAFLAFLIKESRKRRRKQPGKLMARSRSQTVNLPVTGP